MQLGSLGYSNPLGKIMRYRVVLGQDVAKTMENVGMSAMQVLLQHAGNCSPGRVLNGL
jgi:hypothetical protein